MFLRKTRIEPLPVTMSAVRMGDRVLQIGADDPAIASTLASKVGLSGYAAIVVLDDASAARARAAASKAGILIDIKVAPAASLPFDGEAFDLVIVHSTHGLVASLDTETRTAAMNEWHRVLRHGGRVMTIEPGTVSGLKGLLHRQAGNETREASGGVVGALQTAGFKPVRLLADREGFQLAEGVKS
jgi:ubiquinone/menaquinone biosynthesis C-methylase UbiE